MLAEYMLHNLSDGDSGLTGLSASSADKALKLIAAKFGADPANVADYNNNFRNPVLANINAERLFILLGNGGLDAVAAEVGRVVSKK